MLLNYYDRTKGETVNLDIPADVVAVHVPSQDGQPDLVVNVTTDAVLVDTRGRMGRPARVQRAAEQSRHRSPRGDLTRPVPVSRLRAFLGRRVD